MNIIPAMTDPLGAHWRQPKSVRLLEMDDTHVLVPESVIGLLAEYSTSIPTGTYPGKAWKAHLGPGVWALRWYGAISEDGKTIERGQRIIVLVEGE